MQKNIDYPRRASDTTCWSRSCHSLLTRCRSRCHTLSSRASELTRRQTDDLRAHYCPLVRRQRWSARVSIRHTTLCWLSWKHILPINRKCFQTCKPVICVVQWSLMSAPSERKPVPQPNTGSDWFNCSNQSKRCHRHQSCAPRDAMRVAVVMVTP